MLTDRDRLLAEILSNPADEAVRQVYADLLLSEQDPRGELIVLEGQLSKELSDGHRASLDSHRRLLIDTYATTWWPEFPVERLRTRCGFVEAVSGTLDDLVSAGRLFANEPVVEVAVVDATYNIGLVWAAQWQRRVRRLSVRGLLTERGFGALCHAPIAPQLESLDVTRCCIGGRDAEPIADSLPRCRRLVLAGNPLGRHAQTLLRWSHLRSVEHLDLSACELTPAALEAVLERCGALRVLRLSYNPLGDDAARIVAKRFHDLTALERLDIQDAGLSPAGMMTIASACSRSRVCLALTPDELPSLYVLDLLGTSVHLVQCERERWTAEIDGRRTQIRWSTKTNPEQVTELAPLGPLVFALETGAKLWQLSPGHAVVRGGALGAYISVDKDVRVRFC